MCSSDLDIAREFSVGQDEIVMANPEVDRWLPGKDTDVYLRIGHDNFILSHTEFPGNVDQRIFLAGFGMADFADEIATIDRKIK